MNHDYNCVSKKLANRQFMNKKIGEIAAMLLVIHDLPYCDRNGSNLVVKKANNISRDDT